MIQETSMGYYYEDFEIGQAVRTAGRTITETDIVNFAGLTGDFNPLHTDEVFAKEAGVGGRIAHGPMIIGMALGLGSRSGLFDGTVLGLLDLQWQFREMVRPGDTLHVSIVATNKRETRKPDRGIVDIKLDVINQADLTVQTGLCKIMFKRVAGSPAP
jgi:acyl dehydratase